MPYDENTHMTKPLPVRATIVKAMYSNPSR